MSQLTIRDLSAATALDRTEMHAVRGGMQRGFAPFYWAPYVSVSKTDLSFEASQLIGQTQNVTNMNGNNVAFADHIHSTVKPTQSATNNINL